MHVQQREKAGSQREALEPLPGSRAYADGAHEWVDAGQTARHEHALMVLAVMQAEQQGVSIRDAATRIFSNSSGSYSSNINLAVENSSWQDEAQLQEMYLSRKSFAFNSDRYLPSQASSWPSMNFPCLPCASMTLEDVK